MELKSNTTLQKGKYRIVSYIASGGFGNTYEALHTGLDKRVAIKEFFVKDFCNRNERTGKVTVGTQSKSALVDKLKRKFLDEAKAISSLSHSGIVRVFDVFEENGTAYYVMDYIDGQSLSNIVAKEGTLSEERALGYIRQVCEAVAYIHSKNRLHLDIKPSNIMVDANDHPILIDFGASKQYDEENGENTSTLMGKTPGYAPLEQMGNNVVDFTPTTDIYALGATLYKLITGNTPTVSNMRVADGELLSFPDYVSRNTQKAISFAMALRRNDRPLTVKDWLQILGGKRQIGHDIIDETKSDKATASKDDSTVFYGDKKVSPFNFLEYEQYITEEIASGRDTDSLIAYLVYKGAKENEAREFVMNLAAVTPIQENDEEGFKAKIKDWVSDFKSIAIVFAVMFIGGGFRYFFGGSSSSVPSNESVSDTVTVAKDVEDSKDELNGHKFVDLGLSVKWATCNLGADHPLKYGDTYQWGAVNNYNAKEDGVTDIKHSKYDIATNLWGTGWRLPTKAEFEELMNNTHGYLYEQDGVAGIQFEAEEHDQSLFLPFAGYRGDSLDTLLEQNIMGNYWVSDYDSDMDQSWFVRITQKGYKIDLALPLYLFSVRAVTDK